MAIPYGNTEPVETPTSAFFGKQITQGEVEHPAIREASGLVSSRVQPHVLWTHNDSGDVPRLFALSRTGVHLGIVHLEGITARDWEDIALGPGPVAGQDYLYIGDIGDNRARHDLKYIYRIPEPAIALGQAPTETTVRDVETITVRYPDRPRDAEALLLDPISRDLFIVTKRATTVQVYRAAYPQSTTAITEMESFATIALDEVVGASQGEQGAVAGDISADGLELVIKTYQKMFYWSRPSGAVSFFAFARQTVPYLPEPQGEGVAWAGDGSGYFTLSEERNNIAAVLYFYPRQSAE